MSSAAVSGLVSQFNGLSLVPNDPEEELGTAFVLAAGKGKRADVRSFLRRIDEIPTHYLGLALEAAVETHEVLRVQSMLDCCQFMDLVDPEFFGIAIETAADIGSYAVLNSLLTNPTVIQKAPKECYGTALEFAAANNHAPAIRVLLSFKKLIETNVTSDQWIGALRKGVEEEQPKAVRALLESDYIKNIEPVHLARLLYECVNHEFIEVAQVLLERIHFGCFMGTDVVEELLYQVIVSKNLSLLTLLLGLPWISGKFGQIEPPKMLHVAATVSKDPSLVEVLLNCPQFSRHLEKKDLLLVKEFAESRGHDEIVSTLGKYIHSHFFTEKRM